MYSATITKSKGWGRSLYQPGHLLHGIAVEPPKLQSIPPNVPTLGGQNLMNDALGQVQNQGVHVRGHPASDGVFRAVTAGP